jgi:alpha-L-fucosidase
MDMMKTGFLKAALACVVIVVVAFDSGGHAETPAQHEARLAWWRAARFGMFIHWGPVSLTGQEISWSRANSNPNCPNDGDIPVSVYDHLYQRFNPTRFNAEEWVGIAKASGMKYVVLTAKHGDGFLLWDSKVDGYNIGASPFHRDVCAELAAAAHHQHEPIGWYFSPMDWRDPDCRSANNARFVTKIQAELRELLSNYGEISVLWFDLDGRPTMWDPTTTYPLVRTLQPQIVIDNRLEMNTSEEWSHQGVLKPNEDFYTPEQRIGAYDDRTPWETCMTLGTQWSWKPNDQLKTPAQVLRILAQCAGGDGNLLLDVGPMPDGRIEPRQVEILKRVGAWLARNGESIYGTRGGPWKPTMALASTRQGNIIYLHVLGGKTDPIELPGIAGVVRYASLMNGKRVGFTQTQQQLIVALPAASREPGDTVVKLVLEGPAGGLPALEIPPAFSTRASNVFKGENEDYGPQLAFDGDNGTRWATDVETKRAWISVEYVKPQMFRSVRISEAYGDRVQKFEFQCRNKDGWQTILSGSTLGENFQHDFMAVTAKEFRLEILDATSGPTINEIELE